MCKSQQELKYDSPCSTKCILKVDSSHTEHTVVMAYKFVSTSLDYYLQLHMYQHKFLICCYTVAIKCCLKCTTVTVEILAVVVATKP